MRQIIRSGILSLGAVIGLMAAARGSDVAHTDAPVARADLVPGTWQHHVVTINYFGITTLYSCDGLEEHVRSILLHFGARKDAKVSARGCPRAEIPSRSAWIQTDFYSLAPAEAASATVSAYWAPRELGPRRPYFMGDGDCELVEEMKDLISKNFAMRDISYRTECVPHDILLNGFAVKGQALILAPAAGGSAPATG